MDDQIVTPYTPQLVATTGTLTIPIGITQILPFDPTRLALLIWIIMGGGNYNLYLRSANESGMLFTSGGPGSFEFLWQKHGPLVWESLWSNSSFIASTVGYATLNKR